ncbi:MAG: hypothetical protein JW902_07965 [Syntrophaceae bacterium]|nr:hypothetical protein [Syntrophaceae bacterium]
MKSLLFKTCLVVFFAGAIYSTAFASPVGYRVDSSEALTAIMKQVEQTYLYPKGLSFGDMLNNYPVSAAQLFGIGMMAQVDYSKQNQAARTNYLRLSEEIKNFLGQLALIHQTDPNGLHLITQEQLWDAFRQGFTGQCNGWAIANFGLDPFNVRQPSVLNLATASNMYPADERANIPMGVQNDNAINLLDQRANRWEGFSQPNLPPPPPSQPPPPQESKYRWKVLGVYTNPTWETGAFREAGPSIDLEKPIISSILWCCNSTKGCPGRNNVKVVPCKAVPGNCTMKVQLLKDSYLGRKGEIKCILNY